MRRTGPGVVVGIRGALRTLSGAPRLYRAAMLAGADRRGATRALAASALALTTAASRSPRQPGRQNAMRHFVWQGYLAGCLGVDVARALAAAQERGTSRPQDSLADSHNNVAGQQYGVAHAAALAAVSMGSAIRTLADEAERLWQAGLLESVDPRH